MKRQTCLIALISITAILFSQTGCALLTTRRVAMAAGKMVGKKVYEKSKEDKAQKDGAAQQ